MCIHINSGGSATNARGYQDHIHPAADTSTIAYQNVLHEEIYNFAYKGFTDDRGKEKDNFAVLRETTMKAILTENLFISTASEETFLKDDNNHQKIAQGHVNGLVRFFGLKRKPMHNRRRHPHRQQASFTKYKLALMVTKRMPMLWLPTLKRMDTSRLVNTTQQTNFIMFKLVLLKIKQMLKNWLWLKKSWV